MDQAPATIFIFNPDGMHPWLARSTDQSFTELVDTQSIGAAIQNMLLAAVSIGYPDETPKARSRKPLSEIVKSR
jgi:hypothetical protein